MMGKRVFLVVPDVESFPRPPAPTSPHVGLSYIASILEKNGHTVEMFDLRLSGNEGRFTEAIANFGPDIVGITSYSIMYSSIYQLAEEVRKVGNFTTVIGGPHVGSYGKAVLEESSYDLAVMGEGEYTMLDVCAGKPYGEIKGLIWRDGETVRENPRREPIEDLDALPFPAYDKFELDRYLDKKLIIVSTRGCIKKCLYCTIRYTMGPQFRARSKENVVDEIEYWYNRPGGYRFFQFSDDCFSADIERAEAVCDEIIQRKLDIGWELRNGIMINRVTKRLLQKMKDSGCRLIAWGIESIHPDDMRNIKKGITPNQVRAALQMSHDIGMKNSGFFMVGLPGDTYEKFKRNYEFAKSLPLDEVRFYNTTPYPSTELRDWVYKEANWLVDPETFLDEHHANYDAPSFETKEFPAKDRIKALKMGRKMVLELILRNEFGPTVGRIAYQFCRIPYVQEDILRMGAVVFGWWRRFGKLIGREPV